jgi:rod shape-determining protein MreD
MTWLNTVLILFAAFVAVFWEAAFQGIRHLLGAQIDLLPALMVYASLSTGLTTVILLAVLGGLWFDSLSANPLGVTVLPLLLLGVGLYAKRDLILRDEMFARLVIGFSASLAAPLLTLLFLLTTSRQPLVGWGSIWQLLVMGLGGALATPVFFELFGWLHRILGNVPASELTFRPDREIRRGK